MNYIHKHQTHSFETLVPSIQYCHYYKLQKGHDGIVDHSV